MFRTSNHWKILHIESTPENDKDDLKDFKMNILESILFCITSEIMVNRIDAYMTNSDAMRNTTLLNGTHFHILYKRNKKEGLCLETLL